MDYKDLHLTLNYCTHSNVNISSITGNGNDTGFVAVFESPQMHVYTIS